jgi:arginyl-tRNA synthetase
MKGIVRKMIESALKRSIESRIFPYNEIPIWSLEVPKNPEHGDLATNVAMVIASRVKMSPIEIARSIVDRIEDPHGIIRKIEVASPGFINFFLDNSYLFQNLKRAVAEGENYGRCNVGNGIKVHIEFVSANPTGPLHIGHGRGAALGDALANLLEAVGYDVFREYYINDVGNQMETLGRSVYLRYLQLLNKELEFPHDCYQGGYLVDIAREIIQREGDRYVFLPEKESISLLSELTGKVILKGIKEDLDRFRVHYDSWFSERSLLEAEEIKKAIEEMKRADLIYEREGALWFKSTAFGDDKDRVVIKSDGTTTYFASDIAYHLNKLKRGFHRLINIWGADHHGYVPRIKAIIKAIGKEGDTLTVVLVQLVNLMRGGSQIAMSTRAGEFTTLREVIDEVGVDATRYMFLTRSPESHLDFDLELAKKKVKENPVYYIQYAHARICSIMREARERGFNLPDYEDIDIKRLSLPEEISLIKHIAEYPEMIEGSARALEPHRITYYLDELAGIFHSYYNRGWIERKYRVLTDDHEFTKARLYLVRAIQIVIRNALALLKVDAPEEM